MTRWLGNMLPIVGGLVGVVAAILWWLAADLSAGGRLDTMAADFAAIAAANKNAAWATAISAILIAAGEILRAVGRQRHQYFD